MNLIDMERCLSDLASARAIDPKHREAAQRANEALRAFRAAMNLSWYTNSADLHGLASAINNDQTPAQEKATRTITIEAHHAAALVSAADAFLESTTCDDGADHRAELDLLRAATTAARSELAAVPDGGSAL